MFRKTCTLFSIICSVLCFSYGVCIAQIIDKTNFFVLWFLLGILFLLLALATKFKIWQKLNRAVKYTFTATFFVFLAIFIFVEGCIISNFEENKVNNLDYIIVLGAQVLPDGPAGALLPRLKKAVKYLKDNPKTICIVSGGKGENEPFAESFGMAKYLVEQGIDSKRIIEENTSLNTTQNICNSKNLVNLEDKSVGIVTNNFHIFRALSIAKKQGLQNVVGISCELPKFCLANNMLREFFGIIKDKIYGNM